MADPSYLFTLLVFLVVAVMISSLASRLRDQAQAARDREARTHALYRLSRAIAGATEPAEAAKLVAQEVCDLFGAETVVLVPDEKGELQMAASAAPPAAPSEVAVGEGSSPPEFYDANERATAIWVYEHAEAAGAGSETLAGAAAFYEPIRTANDTWGVLGLRRPAPRSLPSPAWLWSA